MRESIAVILAAGDGKRMMSKKPKVLCEVLYKPMLSWVISACKEAEIYKICVVAGYEHEQVEAFLAGSCTVALQKERLGTGHAVKMAEAFLKENEGADLLILCGDAPFINAQTIRDARALHLEQGNSVTVLTAKLENPTGYGRILRDGSGITGIVEQKDATEEQKKIREINAGVYWFKVRDLLPALNQLKNSNANGEYYLTDTIKILLAAGKKAGAYLAPDADVCLGANDRKALLSLNRMAAERVLEKHLENGVGFVSTDGVLIGPDVKIGAGTEIDPNVILKGNTVIGENCLIGQGCVLEDTEVGNGAKLYAVHSEDAVIGDGVKIGPFAHIRPGSVIKAGAKLGNFVEIKNSVIGEKTAVAHLTYVGDSDVGSGVNFGCGVVTVNYDGAKKSRTTIGDNAFIGCNTNLVAPVKIGNTAYTGAGSTITKDVPDGALAVERCETRIVEGYAYRKLKKKD